MMNQMKVKSPQGFQKVNEWMQSNQNPKDIIIQQIKKMTPEQKQAFLNGANNMGVPQNILSELQNLK